MSILQKNNSKTANTELVQEGECFVFSLFDLLTKNKQTAQIWFLFEPRF